jgi:preprotein translocase subunit SecD
VRPGRAAASPKTAPHPDPIENAEETFPVAPPPGTLRVGRYFTALLLLFIVLYGVVFFPGQRHAPKLGIDLVGGIRVVFTALSPKGSPPPTAPQMTQARQILENRINTTGVTGATVVVQGSDQLVVEIPSGTGADVAKLGKAAVLNFRPLVAPAQVVTCVPAGAAAPNGSASASAVPSGSGSASSGAAAQPSPSAGAPSSRAASSSGAVGNAAAERLLAKATTSPAPKTPAATATTAPKASASPTAPSTAIPTTAPARAKCSSDPFAALLKADPKLKIPNAENCTKPAPSKCTAYSALSAAQQQEIAAALQNYDCTAAQAEADLPLGHYVACDTKGQVAYLLGAVVVRGRDIDSASAQAPNLGGGQGGSAEWTVALTLGSTGADSWNAWTSKYNTPSANVSSVQTSATAPCGPAASIPCSDFVGFTLDGQVISAPVTTAALSRQTTISGSFTQTTANQLAQELNYGKLPLSFRADQNEHVSATLGSVQLKAALLAGGIGLILVVIYSLLYYRGLGLVTIASLLVSAGLTYAMLVILGTQIGFTLDLSGIAGFIVALGITADSFVVFFERIKDEVHEGRSVRVAVPRAWVRARRTILSADTVSFLAAAILYYFASADVKGFAFTLGMSTILDLVVVFLFTHPIVSALSRSRAFGSPRFTGLNSVRAGGIVPDSDRPVAKRPAAKAARPAKPVSTSKAVAPVAVLDREDAEEDVTDDELLAETDEAVDTGHPVGTDDERRHTTPEPGTAAERAAARRARLRGKTDEEGTS